MGWTHCVLREGTDKNGSLNGEDGQGQDLSGWGCSHGGAPEKGDAAGAELCHVVHRLPFKRCGV